MIVAAPTKPSFPGCDVEEAPTRSLGPTHPSAQSGKAPHCTNPTPHRNFRKEKKKLGDKTNLP